MSHSNATVVVMPVDSDFFTLPALAWNSPTRYYAAEVRRNLFGDLEFFRAWGGRGSRRGGHKAEPLSSLEAGRDRLNREDARRARRGYVRQT